LWSPTRRELLLPSLALIWPGVRTELSYALLLTATNIDNLQEQLTQWPLKENIIQRSGERVPLCFVWRASESLRPLNKQLWSSHYCAFHLDNCNEISALSLSELYPEIFHQNPSPILSPAVYDFRSQYSSEERGWTRIGVDALWHSLGQLLHCVSLAHFLFGWLSFDWSSLSHAGALGR